MARILLILRVQLLAFVASMAGVAYAQAPAEPLKFDDRYGDAFSNYLPYVVPAKKAALPASAPKKIQPPTPTPPPATSPEKVSVQWLRKNMVVLLERAIDNPTEANVSAYLYAQRITLDKAQRYQTMVTKVNNEDPLLNENNRIPYASTGAQAIRNADYLGQQQAVRELAKQGGIVVFVDGSCRFCAMQLPVLAALKNNFGMEYLVVSIDGASPKGFTGPISKDNGLFQKLSLKLTPSVVFVPSPKAYSGEVDPNRYLVVSQGFYAQDEMVKQISFAGHSTQMLSPETMSNLDVWSRGVASTDDMNTLQLDPNKPETFKQVLQPLLLKQYK